MALIIRLSITGKKGQPVYRVAVFERRSKRDGKCVEIIGYYNPNVFPPKLDIKSDRFTYWQKQGAKVSEGFKNITTLNK